MSSRVGWPFFALAVSIAVGALVAVSDAAVWFVGALLASGVVLAFVFRWAGTGRRRRQVAAPAMAGTAAVAWLLATTRWGSHVGLAPLYLTDVLLLGAALLAARKLTNSDRDWPTAGYTARTGPGLILALFVAWTAVRFVAAGGFSLDAVRDAVPYFYSAVAFLSALATSRSTSQARKRTVDIMFAALLVHLAWTGLVQVAPELAGAVPIPGSPVPFLTVRGDIGGVLIGTLAAISLVRVFRGRRPVLHLMVAMSTVFVMVGLVGRAGWLAYVACLAIGAYVVLLATRGNREWRMLLTYVLAVTLIGGVAAIPQTGAGERLVNAISSEEDGPGAGTVRARSSAWSETIAYTNETVPRQLFGVGFGPNYLSTVGVIDHLRGDRETELRGVHNFAVNTYARLGLVGLLIFALLVAQLVGISARLRYRLATDELLLLSVLLAVTIPVPAMLGVVLESPFGAVPFFWAAGVLLARPDVQWPGGQGGGVPHHLSLDAVVGNPIRWEGDGHLVRRVPVPVDVDEPVPDSPHAARRRQDGG